MSESCAALFASATWKIFSGPLKDSLDAATQVCAGVADTAPRRYAVTDPASATIAAAAAVGATITDGMGVGGRNSTFGQDSAIVQAAPGGTAAITLEALYLAYSRDYVKIYVDTDKEPLVTLSGTALPPFAEGSRTYRSKVGGKVQVRTYRDSGEPGHAGFFSFRVNCADDAGCGGHGTCDRATGACSCQ